MLRRLNVSSEWNDDFSATLISELIASHTHTLTIIRSQQPELIFDFIFFCFFAASSEQRPENSSNWTQTMQQLN